MSDETSLVVAKRMIKAWETLDWDQVVDTFAEQGILQMVPAPPLVGRAAIRSHLDEVASGIERLSFRVKHLFAKDDIVVFERHDEFVYKGKESSVPVLGIMEISGRNVVEWREYFDMSTMLRAMKP